MQLLPKQLTPDQTLNKFFQQMKKGFSPSCSHCGWNEGRFQIGFLCVYLCVTLQRVWALEGEQPGSGERGQWRGSTPRSRVHADHQAAGPQTHPRCHYWEHHQKIWHTLSAYSYTWRYLSRGSWSFKQNVISIIDARREKDLRIFAASWCLKMAVLLWRFMI